MKEKITMKFVTSYYDFVFRAGYCDLQNIFRYEEPRFYNCGVYGWNCDIYTDWTQGGESIAFTTGYRNMRGDSIPSDILKKYDSIAKQIVDDWTIPFGEKKKQLEANREQFIIALVG